MVKQSGQKEQLPRCLEDWQGQGIGTEEDRGKQGEEETERWNIGEIQRSCALQGQLKSQSAHRNGILISVLKTTHKVYSMEDVGRLRKADCDIQV